MHHILTILSMALLVQSAVLAQWQRQNSQTDSEFRGISAVSERVAWASGTHGTVLRTLDGGKTWENVSIPGTTALDFRDIQAFDARTAFVLSIGPGSSSRIYKTADGGKNWRLQFTNPDAKAFYDSFAFWDRKHGIAISDPVGGKFPLLVTEDGETWKPLVPDMLPEALPNEGAFAASGSAIAVNGKSAVWFVTGGPAARVFHSTDRGVHWDVANSPILSGAPSQGVFTIAFRDGSNGIIVGGDYEIPASDGKNAAYTKDGGKTWTLAMTSPRGYRSTVAVLPGSSPAVWITAGPTGSEYSQDGGETWLPLDLGPYNAISFASHNAGWAVGSHGTVARFVGTESKGQPVHP